MTVAYDLNIRDLGPEREVLREKMVAVPGRVHVCPGGTRC
jgi:hypothetical protein